ncbi:Ig-like domain-containing protein [Candidatus Pelagibacter sp.]|nr:Ig-like domain-containing protein [Candidatus Pelagibacter sp.]
MLNFIKKIFSIFSIFLIFNLTFVNSAQAGPTNVTTASVGTGGNVGTEIKPQAIAFNGNGEKMFVLHNRTPSSGASSNSDSVEEYDLGTGFDISASSFGSRQERKIVKDQETAPRGFAFNNNGTKMFVVGATGDDVNEYTISSGFDLSSNITFVDSKDISGQDTDPQGIAFNGNGTKMFVVGNAGDDVNEYTLTTGFDVSSASFVDSFQIDDDQDYTPIGIAFNFYGTKMFVVGDDDNDINEYTLSTAFDVSSASFVDGNGDGTGFSVASQTSTPSGIAFNNDGTKMFVTDRNDADVHSYELDAPFDIGFTDPILSSSVPDDDATGVALNANIVLTFSEIVNVESGNITIHKTSDDSTVETFNVAGSKVTGNGSTEITINPGTDFEDNTEYYVLIPSTAFDDVDSNSYAGIPTSKTTLSFTTTNTIPTLTSSVPDDDATGVALNANIVLTFSEIVNVESGNITIHKTSDNSTVETFDVTGSKVTGNGSTEITINPGTDFDNNTEYYVLIPNTAFDDVDSGSYAGIPSDTEALSFTTTNAVPTLTSSVPADDAIDVERDANIILNFSENVDAETGDIEIYKTSGDVLVETIGVTSNQVTGSGTSQITINPSSNFDSLTEYYVLIDATAFDNSSSGSYAGISSKTALSFTIKAMVDPTTDKDVTGTIDAQNMMAKTTLTEFTSIVNDRLRYLRQNRINKDFTKNNVKLDFGNAMLTSLAKFIPASKIHLTNEILTSLAIDIPTSKTYLTNTILTSLAKVTPVSKVYLTDYVPENWSSWSEGSVSMTKVGDSKNSSSKDIDVQSLALGFDTKLNNNDLLGFAMQFSQSDSEVGTSGTGIDSKNYNLSVYGTRPLNDDNFVEGLFGVVFTENELVRKSGSNTLTGSRNGTQIFGSINYGKTIDKEDFNLTPIARVDLGYTELDAYSELGTDALTYGKQTVESGLVSVGLEINDNIKFSNSSLQPFGSFQYGLDFSNSSDTKMNYVSDTSTIYTYTPGINSTHLLTAEVGFNYELQDHLKLIGIFKRIQGSGSQQTNHIRFGFHYISQRETEYAMSLDGSDELMTGLNISKNINGFDIKLGSNYSLMSEIPDYGINLKISNKF